jgi:hypothetical protein
VRFTVTRSLATALGDIRLARAGDTIWLHPGAELRADWGRYTEALAQAISRGADVRWERL